MRLLLDENLSTSLKYRLERAGHDVVDIHDRKMVGADDVAVFDLAALEGRILITLDRGLGDLRRYRPPPPAGIVIFRFAPFTNPDRRAAIILSVLQARSETDFAGGVAVVAADGQRVRFRK